MSETNLNIGLFDPGMTHLHRVGLAGLFMTLKSLDPADFTSIGGWVLENRRVRLYWNHSPQELLSPIIDRAFGLRVDGSIDYLAHRSHPMGELERLRLHRAILGTFLQHGQTRKLAAKNLQIAVEFGDTTVIENIKPLASYQNQNAAKMLFSKIGDFKNNIELAGWLFPGGVVRHVKYTSNTALSVGPGAFLALVFAPVACLYFLISHRNLDGKYDKRKAAAIVLPHIDDLETYHRCYSRYLTTPTQRLYANSLGDAGLMALLTLHLSHPDGMVESLEIDSCSVMTLGSVSWSKRQKTRHRPEVNQTRGHQAAESLPSCLKDSDQPSLDHERQRLGFSNQSGSWVGSRQYRRRCPLVPEFLYAHAIQGISPANIL